MNARWRQVLLLVLYFLVLMLVARIIDLLIWHLQGLAPNQEVDPRLVLGVRQLKALLDTRGVGYAGCVEKHELAELVYNSGQVVHSEIAVLETSENEVKARIAAPASHFTGGAHFYEEVEDTKDSVWLVQVAPEGAEPPLDDYSWRLVCAHLAPFAIRTGVFDCKLDRRLCTGKGWHEPLLLLALPRGTRAKDKVLMQIFKSTKPQSIIAWVRQQLSDRVERLQNVSEAASWAEAAAKPEADGQVRLLLITKLSSPPLFLAALSVKFAGRVRFGMLQVKNKEEEDEAKSSLGAKDRTTYLVSTPQGSYMYGYGREEHLDFKTMHNFLRAVQPEANDALLVSLALCQLLAVLRAATKRSLLGCLLTILAHNLALLAAWLAILTLSRAPFLATPCTEAFSYASRWTALSKPGLWLRADLNLLARYPKVLLCTLLLFLLCVRHCFLEEPSEGTNFGWRLLSQLLPNPTSTLTSLRPDSEDERMPNPEELLVQRLAVPGLWLTPLVSADYLRTLARWRHRMDVKRDPMSRALIEDMMRPGKEAESEEDSGPPKGALRAAECAICLESYVKGSLLCGLPCGHAFHEACIMAWLLRDHHSCPSCRWPAYKRKKHH
ncbi:E3 ubiquitin-protein ligase RNF103-like isoform X2 [Neocloeon triangulifer]|uniref:E3 ubiquitin-protein ligase RNF103-like isoform X2 n=1 Tax=Neocloeon triangulifer TaxID=2078957 RepID=UPI00286F5980|nr:E3 ubiquitin-protein ligase RNF103-like isoform X2 [Neocloeon triangulifer]